MVDFVPLALLAVDPVLAAQESALPPLQQPQAQPRPESFSSVWLLGSQEIAFLGNLFRISTQ
jgi:hypothetical protein